MNPEKFIKEYSIRSLVCCFSGGKDSLVATHYVLEELKDFEIEKHVVFVDTTVMCPITIDYVKEVSKSFGWNLKILRPEPDFWTLAEKWGAPTMNRRWCCFHLKLKPIFMFVKNLSPQRGMVTRVRRNESERRKNRRFVEYVKRMKGTEVYAWHYHPILEWTEKDVLKYIRKHNLPMPPHYKLGIKETCLCGAFATKKRMMIVKALFPELFQKFIELEKKFHSGGSVFYFNNKPTYAKDLAKQKNLQEFIGNHNS